MRNVHNKQTKNSPFPLPEYLVTLPPLRGSIPTSHATHTPDSAKQSSKALANRTLVTRTESENTVSKSTCRRPRKKKKTQDPKKKVRSN